MSRSILKQSSKVGILSLMSRVIAFVREWLLIQFLSVGDSSDVFFTAFRIPNTLRKIFAEGALSSILVPACINAQHTSGQDGFTRLTTSALLHIQAIIIAICCTVFYFSAELTHLIVPGFAPAKAAQASSLLRILISFIFFISSGSIFAAALQSQRRFFIPAIAPSILNIAYVASLAACLYLQTSIQTFCVCMILTSVIFLLLHVVAYFHAGYRFATPNQQTSREMKKVLTQLLPCILSVGIAEVNHFINTSFASYLTSGSMTLLRTSFQFVNIPVGIITASLVTVLLPHFSKTHLENPKDLINQLFEAMKFIIWATMPIWFMLTIFSGQIFETLFMKDAQALGKIILAQSIFKAYLIGLLAFSLNKVFLSIFFALQRTMVPMYTSLLSIAVNYSLTRILINDFQAAGIACAASVAAIAQTVLLAAVLSYQLKITWSGHGWFSFLTRYAAQFTLCSGLLYLAHQGFSGLIATSKINMYIGWISINSHNLTHGFMSWLWTGPLALAYLAALYFSRPLLKIKLSYLDEKTST